MRTTSPWVNEAFYYVLWLISLIPTLKIMICLFLPIFSPNPASIFALFIGFIILIILLFYKTIFQIMF